MKKLSVSVLPSALLLLAGQGLAQSFTYLPIDVKCDASASPSACPSGIAPGGAALQTVASGINPAGRVVGRYVDSVGRQHGFLLSAGQFTTIDFPGAVATSANGISPSGDIVGNYTAPYIAGVSDVASADPPAYCPAAGSAACIKGFRYHDGEFSTVLFPGHPGAIAQRIAPDGAIYGCLHDFDLGLSMVGAVWNSFGDASLTGNGGEAADSMSRPMSMNNGATPDGHLIVGLWTDMTTGRLHGFIVRNEQFQSYDVPGATVTATATWDVNPSEQFVGTYVIAGVRHGFLQNPDGSAPINIDFPGAAATVAFGINPGGVIVGQYLLGGRIHGFAAVPPISNYKSRRNFITPSRSAAGDRISSVNPVERGLGGGGYVSRALAPYR